MNRSHARTRLAIAVAVLLTAALAACGDDDETASETAAASAAPASTAAAADAAATAGAETAAAAGDSAAAAPGASDGPGVVELKGWASAPAPERYKILYLSATPLNTYVQAMEAGARNAAERLGVDIDVVYNEWNAQQQLSQVQDAIGKKDQYDGIVTGGIDPNVLCKALSKDAPDAGLPVVIINFPLCGDDDYTPGTVGLSASQSIHFFRKYVDWVFGTVPDGAKVGVITGPAEEGHTVQMKRALDEAKEAHPNVEVVQIVSGDYTAEAGLSETETLLQGHPDLDMIVSTYDQNTVGAVKALQAANKQPGDIKLWNLGGEKVTRQMMADGWIEGTMYLDPVNEVGQGIEMMVAHLEGKEVPTFNDLSAGEIKMTKDTVSQFPEDF